MADQIKEVLANDDKVLELAKAIYQNKSMLVMGRGWNYATCLEGALVSLFLFCNTFKEKTNHKVKFYFRKSKS